MTCTMSSSPVPCPRDAVHAQLGEIVTRRNRAYANAQDERAGERFVRTA
jgi:hypothetical protein